jgi:DNA polymerase III epsilon subunit-like protein
MKLNITKPLVVFDLETTGLDLVKDRIIQISYIKVYPDGKEERQNLKTGKLDSIENYHGCGAIWFRIKAPSDFP